MEHLRFNGFVNESSRFTNLKRKMKNFLLTEASWPELVKTIVFFTVYTKLAEMALLASKDLTTAEKVTWGGGPNLMQGIITG